MYPPQITGHYITGKGIDAYGHKYYQQQKNPIVFKIHILLYRVIFTFFRNQKQIKPITGYYTIKIFPKPKIEGLNSKFIPPKHKLILLVILNCFCNPFFNWGWSKIKSFFKLTAVEQILVFVLIKHFIDFFYHRVKI